MQTDFLYVCVRLCVRVCAVGYTRDEVQSRAIERKEKAGGELMRKQWRIQAIPIDNLPVHFKHTRTLAPFLKSPLKVMVQH